MSVRTEAGQSTGTNRGSGLPQVHRSTVSQMLSGRIRSGGYSRIIQSACISVLRCHPGTSASTQVDDVGRA
jgi:hypothetical protein